MVTLLAHIKIKPDQARRYEELQRQMVATTKDEEGCLRYEFWRGEAPNSYYGLLSFTDSTAFYQHQASPHHDGFTGDFVECCEGLRLEFLDPLEGGGSGLSPTIALPLPADADAATRGMAERFAVAPAVWWAALRPVT